MPNASTIALLLTLAGAALAAPIVTGIVEFLKNVPAFGVRYVSGHEKGWAFLVTIVVVVYAYIVGLSSVPPTQTLDLVGILTVPIAIYMIGRLSMAIHDDVTQKPNSLTG